MQNRLLVVLDLGGVVFNVHEAQFRDNLCSISGASVATSVVQEIRSLPEHERFEEGKLSDREFGSSEESVGHLEVFLGS